MDDRKGLQKKEEGVFFSLSMSSSFLMTELILSLVALIDILA
jgi:hypothetical protein